MIKENRFRAGVKLNRPLCVQPNYNCVLQTAFVEDQALCLTLKVLHTLKARQALLKTTSRS